MLIINTFCDVYNVLMKIHQGNDLDECLSSTMKEEELLGDDAVFCMK